jgi:hypothetical protein
MKILQEFRGAVSEYGLSKKSSACFGQHTAYGEAELEVRKERVAQGSHKEIMSHAL